MARSPGASVRVTGVDACRGGWVAVTLTSQRAAVTGIRIAVAGTLDGLGLAAVTGIDMPLGLLAAGWRTADLLARHALGSRGSCVFAIPPRPVWTAPDYPAANQRCRELTGRGLSAQAWGLRVKLAETDAFRLRAAHPLYEVHPELSFAALSGAPLAESKHTEAGQARRRALLAQAGIELPTERIAGAGADDLLDAAAAAWSARRIAAGMAVVLTDPAQRADDGSEIGIWC